MFPERYNRATRMLYHACEFSESADLLLREDRNQKLGACERYFNSAVICLSLSCEVYLKTLLMYYNLPVDKIHTLNELFNKLPEELKQTIKNESNVDESFIKEFSNIFITRRYFYENDESITFLSIGNLVVLRNVLRNESCRAVHSLSWDEYRKKMGW